MITNSQVFNIDKLELYELLKSETLQIFCCYYMYSYFIAPAEKRENYTHNPTHSTTIRSCSIAINLGCTIMYAFCVNLVYARYIVR